MLLTKPSNFLVQKSSIPLESSNRNQIQHASFLKTSQNARIVMMMM